MTAFDSQCDCQFHGVDMDEIRIVLAGLRSEDSIAALCRRKGIAERLYYYWSEEFLEPGKNRLASDTVRQATALISRYSPNWQETQAALAHLHRV